MKIYFFKNESHFHPRISYTFENAELIRMDDKIQNLKKCSTWLFMLPLLIFTFVFLKDLGSNVTILIAIWIFGLPAHELCHALFCWITGRKVERIMDKPATPPVTSEKGLMNSPTPKARTMAPSMTNSAFLSVAYISSLFEILEI